MSLRTFALGAALVCAFPAAAATEFAVIGDSLGVGVSWAAKPPLTLAKNSVAIHGGAILEQIRRLPRGVTAFMSLGTNDAVGGAVDVKKPVQDILAAAAARDVKLVWLGPPCVFKSWDKYARELDANLREQLEGHIRHICRHAGRRHLQPLPARPGGGSFQYGGLYANVAQSRRGGGISVVVAVNEKLGFVEGQPEEKAEPEATQKKEAARARRAAAKAGGRAGREVKRR